MDKFAKQFIEEEPRHRIGQVLGVEVATTRRWWFIPLGVLLGGQVLSRLFGKSKRRWRTGLGFSAILCGTMTIHQLGHIVSARKVEAPMDTLLLTPVRIFTLYDDTGKTIRRDQHIGRAVGGPAANLTVGVGAMVLSRFGRCRKLRYCGIVNLLVGSGALIPVAGNDGETLIRSKN